MRSAVFYPLCAVGILFYQPQPCQAQQSAQPVQLPAQFNDPLKQISWISGPQKVSIGDIADINVPQGYKLTHDVQGARIILDSMNISVPNDVVGVLESDSGNWWALIEYSSKGYVQGADVSQANPKTVLKAITQIQTQDNGQAPTLKWNSQPTYDPQTHSLAWSLQVQTASSKTLNQGEALLGRHGYIEITAVESYPLSAAPDLNQVVANIDFKDGERYADYQTGDKLAEIGLAEVITGQKPAKTGIFSSGFGGAAAALVYGGLALLALGGLIVLRKNSRRRVRHAHAPAAVPATMPAAVPVAATATVASANGSSPVLKNGELNGHSEPKIAMAGRNGSKQLHRNRRKRVFDYSKFYTTVVKELSLHSYGTGTMVTNGKFNSNGRANGHTNGYANGNGHANGHTNGHANGHTNGNGANGNGSGTNGNHDVIKSEIEQLIATQKHLIQEQKCLLEQQTKLIEEKRWLIQEQSTFLKGQASLIQEQQFPLKFE